MRYAYWAAGATVVFTYDGANWRVALEPVYANTVTVGNAASGNIFIDSDSVDFMSGSFIFISLLNDSNGAHLHSINTLFLECMGLQIKDQSKMGVSIWLDDLVLRTASEAISLRALSSRVIPTINFGSLVKSITNTTVSGSVSWTATQDCWCFAEIYANADNNYNATLYLNNVMVAKNSNGQSIMVNFPVKKGQVFKKTNGVCSAKFYAMS